MTKVVGSRCSNFPNGVRTDRDVYIGPIVFASSSAVVTNYVSVPFKCEVVEVQIVQKAALPAAPGTWTLKVGSAGDTIATVTPSSAGVAGNVTQQTTITNPAVDADESISIARATSGTAYEAVVGIVVKRVD